MKEGEPKSQEKSLKMCPVQCQCTQFHHATGEEDYPQPLPRDDLHGDFPFRRREATMEKGDGWLQAENDGELQSKLCERDMQDS